MYHKYFVNLFIFSLIAFNVRAQTPSWTDYNTRTLKFPEEKFLVGFASENNPDKAPEGDLLKKLSGYAKDQLVENIMVDVRSVTTLNVLNVNAQTLEELKKTSSSISQAKIVGLQTEQFYDPKKKQGFAIAYAERSKVVKDYKNLVSQLITEINDQYNIALQQKEKNQIQLAAKSLYKAQTDLKELEEAQSLLVSLTGKVEDPAIGLDQSRELSLKVENTLSGLRNGLRNSIDELAYFLVESIGMQTNSSAPIQVQPFTFEDTPMGSPFSRKLATALENKIVAQGKIPVVQGYAKQAATNVVQGTYWDELNFVKVIAIVRNVETGQALASATASIDKSKLTAANSAYRPENYKQALINQKLFAENELKSEGLQVDILTNKGGKNLFYSEGEELKLLARANRECYLRFIYHLADGSKVLLLDNYYVNRDKVNQYYELPYEFECAEPFGVETLQLNAQTKPFEPLQTSSEYGYDFIVEDTDEVLVKTRGFKRKDTSKEEVLKAESRLVINTMRD
jgi:hypothetical protein